MNPLKRLRTEVLGINQAAMAEVAGVTQATVSRWENGEGEPSLSELLRIQQAYPGKVDLNALRPAPESPPPDEAAA
jgi:transcriptional regulator with XRE-family HTH domain